MNTEVFLYQSRKRFRELSSKISVNSISYNLLLPPIWMIRARDRRFCSLYRDQHILFTKGQIVWGTIIQANVLLFKPGKANCPAAIVYSPDTKFHNNPGELGKIARELYELKNKIIEHPEVIDLKIFAEAITNEMDGLLNIKIPNYLTSNNLVYYTSIMVYRKHLPLGYLKQNYFPVLVAPKYTSASMILPSRYWCPTLTQIWCANWR